MVFADESTTEKATAERETEKGFYILLFDLSIAGFVYDASSYIFALLPSCYIIYKEEYRLCTDNPAPFHTSAPTNTLS